MVSIDYSLDREIIQLGIANASNEIVYSWADLKKIAEKEGATLISKGQMQRLRKELERTGVDMGAVLERYGVEDETMLTTKVYEKAMKDLKRTPTKNVEEVA